MTRSNYDQMTANASAWHEGMRRLNEAIASRQNYAFETTLGGKTVSERILLATETHDVQVWFCGLASPELHIARVQMRVLAGGHPVSELKIRERYPKTQLNLIRLMPHLAYLGVYDNSAEADGRGIVPDPVQLLEMERGNLIRPSPDDPIALGRTPDWARPIVGAALRLIPRVV
jgi:predicted ABC-type ATPase